MGRRPTLPAIKKLEGNPGKRRIIDSGVEASGPVFIPAHLHDEAKRCVELIRSSMPESVYASVDSYLIGAFATAWALHREAVEAMSQPDFEHIVSTVRAEQLNPWLRTLNTQAMLMTSIGDRLGLSPKARASLHLPDEQPPSKFAGLMGSRKLDA